MKSIDLSAELRDKVGSKNARDARKANKVTAVLYGGEKNYDLLLKRTEVEKILTIPEALRLNVKFGDRQVHAVLKEVQFDPVSDYPVHADLMEISDQKKITLTVPVKLVGNAKGVMAGGVLQWKQRKLKAKGLPSHLPDHIEVDISSLDLGQSIRIKDVQVPNVELIGTPNAVIVAVKTARAAMESAAQSEAAAPSAPAPAAASQGSSAKTAK